MLFEVNIVKTKNKTKTKNSHRIFDASIDNSISNHTLTALVRRISASAAVKADVFKCMAHFGE